MRFSSLRSIAVGAAICTSAGFLAAPATVTAAPLSSGTIGANGAFSALTGSVRPTTDIAIGAYTSPKMTITIALAPNNASQLSGLLATVTNPKSSSYRHWLRKGQFNALFAPSAAQTAALTAYLRGNGLVVGQSPSPFFVRASGSSSAVSAAFRTSLRAYRNPRGVTYFSNASAVQLPANIAAGVIGVVGLSSTAGPHPQFKLASTRRAKLPQTNTASATTSCEAPYPTADQLFLAVFFGIGFPFGYGGGPGCNGLTPAQDNAIYGAPNVGPRGKGAGVNLAVFELSAYQHSDIVNWAHYFYGPHFTPPLVDITVDGGPLSPICPAFDLCPAEFNGYSGDIEVDADIENQLAFAPAASHILVYNAPNDVSGQTELDEYTQIANDDIADVVSSSWAVCENAQTPANAQAENLVFEQMALQGQSMFSSAGDTGAFECIRSNGSTLPNQLDPASQPWVTSVGGTSFESFNPGTSSSPSYPTGVESVWNVAGLCNTIANEGGEPEPGYFWCAETGAGGGGNSQYWARPFFQYGPGISNPYSEQCALASIAQPCREGPDVSANADEYTPYAEYCTGSSATPYSTCATIASNVPVPAGIGGGWFGIGGTSLSSPLWSAVIADRDGYQGTRTGPASILFYDIYSAYPSGYFNDITGIGQTTNNNGLYPTVPGYDLATGIGTPKMTPIITGVPQH